jgi:tetratricopeptide (TPR) repeat protein
MMEAVHRYEGYVAQVLGDGIFAFFGAPLAHEDHPQRALYAALRMQEEMRRYADTLRQKGYPPLLMRVGMNTGEVVLRSIRKDDLHADYVPVGHATNLAARMEQLAAPGSIAEQLGRLAQRQDDAPFFQAAAAGALANTFFYLGQLPAARVHFEQYIAAYNADPQRHHSLVGQFGLDVGVTSRLYLAFILWALGFPDQVLKRSAEALTFAQELAHPISMTVALEFAARVYTLRQEGQAALEQAEAAMRLSTELGATLLLAWSTAHQGWALGARGQHEHGISQLREDLAICRAAGAESWVPYYLALLAETQAKAGQSNEGLRTGTEALEMSNRRGNRWYEAELYRLRGEILLAQEDKEQRAKSEEQGGKNEERGAKGETDPRFLTSNPQADAEASFLRAIEVSRCQ